MIVKELDEETGLYYYGARYLDPRTSRWLTGDPAIYQGDYIPVAPINDDARKHNQNLPGMGGIFNIVNMHAYHYAGNNPVKYVDPTGEAFETIIDIISLGYSAYELIKDPSLANVGFLALDVIGAAVPFVPALGSIARAGRAASVASNAAQGTRATNSASDVVRSVVRTPSSDTRVITVERNAPNVMRSADVTNSWNNFLGENTTNINPITGRVDTDRIFSADGTRSIRFGNHEMRSIGTPKGHFHFETWNYNSTTDVMTVTNILQRID